MDLIVALIVQCSRRKGNHLFLARLTTRSYWMVNLGSPPILNPLASTKQRYSAVFYRAPFPSSPKNKTLETLRSQGFILVDDTGLDPVTSHMSSGMRYFLHGILIEFSSCVHSLILIDHYGTLQYDNYCRHRTVIRLCRAARQFFPFPGMLLCGLI